MKNTVKWIIIALLLVAVIVAAAVLYDRLGAEYGGDNLVQNTDTTPADSESTPENEAHQAPDFEALDADGKKVRLSDYKGKPIVLNFWATWCYYCKQEMPDFNEAYKNYPDIQFLMVNATDGVRETIELAKAYVEGEGFEFEVLYDTALEAVNSYYVTGFPQTFFIDAEGRLIAQRSGMLDYESLERGISMIKGEEQ